ncbi:hypothetical protein GCM10010123_01560 [Pilimelia anulata]|uniref:Uncharacterized protein n=1 Tax=Pilimelia anulata TaxID=53371 RepID=A0A8J3F5U6_9ACTN|nr:hypothetical protein [Pilimelia anulata]GGJ75247.1 hypothetical protein GCM10010123_01560 [Pilimelia anulata]
MNHDTPQPTVPDHNPHSDTGQPLRLEVSHHEMGDAFDNGTATTLSDTITDFVLYQNAWWIADLAGWLRITDDLTIHRLERHARWARQK